jgi:hypothetical protein
MKVKRKDWEALHARIKQLEFDMKLAHSNALMQSRTGPILLNVVVPMILRHLKVETRHGFSEVQPVSESAS